MKKAVELDLNSVGNHCLVYLVWSGVRRLRETHNLRRICTEENVAELCVQNMLEHDKEYFHDWEILDYWVEPRELDHLYGEDSLKKGRDVLRELHWRKRSGD